MVDLSAVRRIILVQLAASIVIGLVMLWFQGVMAAVSAFVGGAIGFTTSLIYAWKMLAPPGSEIKKLIHAHYKAEAYKLAFTILLFSFVFTQFKEVAALPLFAGYAVAIAVYWVALIFV